MIREPLDDERAPSSTQKHAGKKEAPNGGPGLLWFLLGGTVIGKRTPITRGMLARAT